MDQDRPQQVALRPITSLNLVHDLLGLASDHGAPCGEGDFASSVAASNGLPIPFQLLVQCRLASAASPAHARLLAQEYQHKVRLLDRDRHIAACLCEFGTDSALTDGSFAACVRALGTPPVPLILACDWQAEPREWPLMPRAAELVLTVPLDVPPILVERRLHAWRALLAPSARLVVAVQHAAAVAEGGVAAHAALLGALAAGADALYLLPLVAVPADEAPSAQSAHLYRELAALLVLRGWQRLAPGLYAQGSSRWSRPPFLLRLMSHLPSSDVLGLGPAGRSRINELSFANFAAFDDYAHDVSQGGFGVAAMHALAPTAQFVEELLLSLAGGAMVDVTALARRCRCASPAFLQHCDTVFAGLAADGAITRAAPRHVSLGSGNDANFAVLRATLLELRSYRSPANVASLR